MKIFSTRDAGNRISECVRLANDGETIVITNRGQGVAKIVKLEQTDLDELATQDAENDGGS